MRILGVSALAGAACVKQPDEEIVPWVEAPEGIVPGKPLFYATAVARDGYGTGVVVECHMGRPTRVDGNAKHPASLGRLDAVSQASIYGLWDPRRSKSVLL